MKHLFFPNLIFSFTLFLFTSDKSLAQNPTFLNQNRIPVLVALRCADQLKLLQTKHWLDAGWAPPPEIVAASKTANFSTMQETAYQVANRLSPLAAFMIFKQSLPDSSSSIELDPNASFSNSGLRLPSQAEGCDVVPLAVDMSSVRQGATYIVDETTFRELSVLDQLITKLLLQATRPDSLRYLLDTRSIQGTDAERINRARQAKIPTIVLRGYEYESGEKTLTHPNGALALGYFNLTKEYLKQRFFESGQILSSESYYKEKNFVKIAKATEPFDLSESTSETMKCTRVQYLSNGKLLSCDDKVFDGSLQVGSRHLRFYFLEDNPEKVFSFDDSNLRSRVNEDYETSIDYTITPSSRPRTVTTAIAIDNTILPLKSIQRLAGDAACEGLRFTKRAFNMQERASWNLKSKDGPRYSAMIELPVACSEGALRLKF